MSPILNHRNLTAPNIFDFQLVDLEVMDWDKPRSSALSFNRPVRSISGAYTLHRSRSSSDLPVAHSADPVYVSDKYRPVRYQRYHRDSDLYDDYWWDRRFNTSSLYWPHHCWPNRRSYQNDPHSSLWWYYPSLSWYPKYNRSTYQDSLDPVQWRRHYDPSVDRPLCQAYKPWTYETDSKLTAKMYRKNLISFADVENRWLVPKYYKRRFDELSTPYQVSTWYTSPRRYFYSFDNM